MELEDLGLIGNCQYSALISRDGAVVWCCLPRFDSDPIFASLLDCREGGEFRVGAAHGQPGTQRYLENSNVLETRFEGDGSAFRVLDFAPRFLQYDRVFRPTMLVRIIEPLSGTPHVRVSCTPHLGWSRAEPRRHLGSHHVQFEGFESPVRLTTDIPLSYLGGHSFALTERRYVVLTWGQPIEESLPGLCDRFLSETTRYWHRWVKQCNVPTLHQAEVIRSALALKLHCFEDTGAIVAAMTTSIPESPGSGRTGDYRYCWLRDAYYSLEAFRLLGHFEEREGFVRYLLDVIGGQSDMDIRPLYRVDGGSDLDERLLTDWPGFNGDGPVRIGNAAVNYAQYDIFGEMVLALAPIFVDERFRQEQSRATLELLERLARQAVSLAGQPDAGIWEPRTEYRPQSCSSLMCWAAADRMPSLARHRSMVVAEEFEAAAGKIHRELAERAWNADLGSFVGRYDGADLDASLLQMVALGFLPPNDTRLQGTIDAVRSRLSQDGWLFRYRLDDGLGQPQVAFTICTFWLIEALAFAGRRVEAAKVMSGVLSALQPLGLLSEDYETSTMRMWGNFPQAYSHVGLIHAAFAASPTWRDVV